MKLSLHKCVCIEWKGSKCQHHFLRQYFLPSYKTQIQFFSVPPKSSPLQFAFHYKIVHTCTFCVSPLFWGWSRKITRRWGLFQQWRAFHFSCHFLELRSNIVKIRRDTEFCSLRVALALLRFLFQVQRRLTGKKVKFTWKEKEWKRSEWTDNLTFWQKLENFCGNQSGIDKCLGDHESFRNNPRNSAATADHSAVDAKILEDESGEVTDKAKVVAPLDIYAKDFSFSLLFTKNSI